MTPSPWPDLPPDRERFRRPPRAYGILPFWFLNGELDPDEMRWQLRELRDKGMPGVILHARYGLEMPYLGEQYLDRIALAAAEARRLGLQTWVYDEMNWPSGTADGRVPREHPDLAQRYLECVSFPMRGPWFTYLTGADSRYLDFERSTPVAAFAISADGQVVDLTPNLSFENVIPWQAPPGNWRIAYVVEKRADYYIDALNPAATAEFLRVGYAPYLAALDDGRRTMDHETDGPPSLVGFYTDEPAMHYYLTGGDNPIVPWTRDMFRRFQERCGYNLRPRLADLFFDLSADSARVRYDFYSALTAFYSDAYYRQIHAWCRAHGTLFTGHLLYEEWLRKMIRVEGNPYAHYRHMDVIGVDHLYPFIGTRDRPDEHVAIKLAASAAHQLGSQRLLCESFGGIFMDATMQRMKWVADWQYVLGVNLLNPHGFHYTLEGPRKRDWPPSMFYQFPWWHFYGAFSDYIARLSHMLTGGHHVARVAVLWPINAMFASYTPDAHSQLADRTEHDFNALTDLLLRLHYDFDYLDEDVLAEADVRDGAIRVRDETYELLVLPPMTHLKIETMARIERLLAGGGRALGMVFLPDRAFGPAGLIDIAPRIAALFGVDPAASQREHPGWRDIEALERDHPGRGRTTFLRTHALARLLPERLKARSHAGRAVIETAGDSSRYFFVTHGGEREEITAEVAAERQAVADALGRALGGLIAPDVTIDNPELFYLHRVKDGRDVYFLVNPTHSPQAATVTVGGCVRPLLWDPSTGDERPVAPWELCGERTRFALHLPPVGSAFVLTLPDDGARVVETNVLVESLDGGRVAGYTAARQPFAVIERDGRAERLEAPPADLPAPLTLDGPWAFDAEGPNTLVIGGWLATTADPEVADARYAHPAADTSGWLPMVPGAWSYQLPAEPARPYPIDVWYRASFTADELPPRLDLIADGFAGAAWRLYVNGEPVAARPERSVFDSQMLVIDITKQARRGANVIALKLTLTNPTDGLLDLLKLAGDFSLAADAGGEHRIAAPRRELAPESWAGQGYPFYSGLGVYRRSFQLPESYAGCRVFIEPAVGDDALEVLVNGAPAGVRLWPPYEVEITGLLRPGENTLELRVANTPANRLEGTPRPSGVAGPARLVAYRAVDLVAQGGSDGGRPTTNHEPRTADDR